MRFFVKSGIIEVGNAYPDLDYPEYHKIIYYTFFLKKKKKNVKHRHRRTEHSFTLQMESMYFARNLRTELVSYLLADSYLICRLCRFLKLFLASKTMRRQIMSTIYIIIHYNDHGVSSLQQSHVLD